MITKKILILLFGIFLIGCTSEPDLHTYTTYVTNESSSIVFLKGYNAVDELVYDQEIAPMGSSDHCVVNSETFLGLSCGIDSLVVTFANSNKGYSCANREHGSVYCFGNKSPLDGTSDFEQLSENTYAFILTEEDYENALELP